MAGAHLPSAVKTKNGNYPARATSITSGSAQPSRRPVRRNGRVHSNAHRRFLPLHGFRAPAARFQRMRRDKPLMEEQLIRDNPDIHRWYSECHEEINVLISAKY